MKKILRNICLTLAVLLTLSAAACGKSASGSTLIFGKTDLSDYVKLGDYKSLSVDTASDEFKAEYDNQLSTDIKREDLYAKKYEGKVAEGDTANIDYVGKKDGVAFAGGTAEGYDLTIGSHTFIDGFEDGLIGVNIGDTVDLNLTFPEDYQSEELAGKAVVFTVKVNYVKSSDMPGIEDIYSQLGYKSVNDYKSDLEKRAVKNILFENVVNSSEIEGYPEIDKKTYISAVYKFYDNNYKKERGVSFEEVLASNNMTVEDFKSQIAASAEGQLYDHLISYAILQKENLKAEYDLSEDETVNQEVLDEMAKVYNVVKDYLYSNAKIK